MAAQEQTPQTAGPDALPRLEPYKTKMAASDLLGLSTAVALLVEGIQSRLRQEELERTLTEEQQERLKNLFLKLHGAADDVADFARELAEQAKRSAAQSG